MHEKWLETGKGVENRNGSCVKAARGCVTVSAANTAVNPQKVIVISLVRQHVPLPIERCFHLVTHGYKGCPGVYQLILKLIVSWFVCQQAGCCAILTRVRVSRCAVLPNSKVGRGSVISLAARIHCGAPAESNVKVDHAFFSRLSS